MILWFIVLLFWGPPKIPHHFYGETNLGGMGLRISACDEWRNCWNNTDTLDGGFYVLDAYGEGGGYEGFSDGDAVLFKDYRQWWARETIIWCEGCVSELDLEFDKGGATITPTPSATIEPRPTETPKPTPGAEHKIWLPIVRKGWNL